MTECGHPGPARVARHCRLAGPLNVVGASLRGAAAEVD